LENPAQLRLVERGGAVVMSAGFEGIEPLIHFGMPGDHDDGYLTGTGRGSIDEGGEIFREATENDVCAGLVDEFDGSLDIGAEFGCDILAQEDGPELLGDIMLQTTEERFSWLAF